MTYHDERRSGMTRNTALKLKNKYVLLSIAAVLGILTFQSWKDILPKEHVAKQQRSFGSEHLITTPTALAALPDDMRMAILDIGRIQPEADKLIFAGNGVEPVVTAGREANLLFHMEEVPAGRLFDALPVIDQQVKAWRAKNIVMSTIFIRLSKELVKDPEFFSFVERIFKDNGDNYWIGVAVDYQDVQQDPALRTALANTQKYVRDFVFFYDGQKELKDFIPALEEFRLPYSLVLEHEPEDIKTLRADLNARDVKSLNRFVVKR